jgi:hypothetical protein
MMEKRTVHEQLHQLRLDFAELFRQGRIIRRGEKVMPGKCNDSSGIGDDIADGLTVFEQGRSDSLPQNILTILAGGYFRLMGCGPMELHLLVICFASHTLPCQTCRGGSGGGRKDESRNNMVGQAQDGGIC